MTDTTPPNPPTGRFWIAPAALLSGIICWHVGYGSGFRDASADWQQSFDFLGDVINRRPAHEAKGFVGCVNGHIEIRNIMFDGNAAASSVLSSWMEQQCA